MDSQAPDIEPEIEPGAVSPATPEAATDPAALSDLVAARLVSHELICDPAQLGSETATLRSLCTLISGPIYRLDPFHYAFRAAPRDLGGRLGDLEPEDWTGAVEAAVRAELGADAVWLNATDPLEAETAALDQPLLLLRAQGAAVAEGLETVGPDLQAVINARYAARCARLTASEEAGTALARRLALIEVRQEEIVDMLAVHAEGDPLLARLSETLAALIQRLDAQTEVLRAQELRADALAARLDEIGREAGAFQESLGVTLAEFLARLEKQAEERAAPGRVPQFN